MWLHRLGYNKKYLILTVGGMQKQGASSWRDHKEGETEQEVGRGRGIPPRQQLRPIWLVNINM